MSVFSTLCWAQYVLCGMNEMSCQINYLFSNFFCKNVAFTKFLLKTDKSFLRSHSLEINFQRFVFLLVLTKLFFSGGPPNGTHFTEMATWLHDQNFASRTPTIDAFERKYEVGPASGRKCLLKTRNLSRKHTISGEIKRHKCLVRTRTPLPLPLS